MNEEIKRWIEDCKYSTETLSYDEARKRYEESEMRLSAVLRQGRSKNWKKLVAKADKESKIALANKVRAIRAVIAEVLPDLALEFARGIDREVTEEERRILDDALMPKGAEKRPQEGGAKIRVLHTGPYSYLELDYDDIVNLICDPMYIANDKRPEQKYFFREQGRNFVQTFVSRLRKAIDIMEKTGSVEREHANLDIYIPGYEFILFRSDCSCSAGGLDTKRLSELLAGKNEKKEDHQIGRAPYRARWIKL
jgi:hypothetical protein